VGLVAMTVLAFALAPAAAQADLTWSSTQAASCSGTPPTTPPCPQLLSPSGTNASAVHVATDATGDAVAVWLQVDAGVTRVAEARRAAGQDFGAPSYISDTTADAYYAEVAMNPSGEALVTWVQYPNCACLPYVDYTMAPAAGSFGTPQTIPGIADAEPVLPALDAAGDAVIAYQDQSPDGIAVEYRPAGSSASFSAPQQVTDPPAGDPYTPSFADTPTVAMDSAGDALVTWSAYVDTGGGSSTDVVQAAYRPAGTSSGAGFGPLETLSDPSADAGEPSPALDGSGNGIVAFQSTSGSLVETVDAAYRPKTQGSFNKPATTVSDGSVNSTDPDVAFGPTGDAFLVWAQYANTNNTGPTSVQAAYRASGGAFGSSAQVSTVGVNAVGPKVGVDSLDRPAILWDAVDASGNDTVQAVSRVAGPGAFSTPQNLSQTGDFGTADEFGLDDSAPKLSVSGAGQTVAIWQMVDTNSSQIAEASFGTPPESSPPPPPPPPPPPIPSAIIADTQLQVGKPAVFTVKITGDVNRLQWKLGYSTFTGYGQDSIRFTPTDRTFTLSVTAIGPGGSRTYSRAFTIAKASTDRDAVAVRQALSGTPTVFGIGDAQTLLGHTACGAVTVYSGQQQVSGCMRPINLLSDVPAQERGAIQTMARSLGLDPNDAGLMSAAVQEVDGYVGVGPTTLDGKWPVVPKPGASVISFPGVGALTSSGASLDIGGLKFGGLSGGFSLNIDPSKLSIPLGSLPKPDLPDIGGFPLIGDWNIDLGDADATIDTHLSLPSWLSIGGVPLHIPITFKATPSGLVLNSLNIGPINANLGPLNVTKLKLTYDRPSDTWTGSGNVCLFTGACLDMSPPDGEVKIVHGALNYAGATLVFPEGSGIPLFAGVDLTKIGFGIGLDPTRIIGRGAISVLDLVQLNGQLVTGFPTAGHPFVLARDEVGNDFPPEDYGPAFTEPTIGASADVSVNLPDIGFIGLGSGYLLFEIPDYIAVGGGFNINVLGVVQLYGNISGAANFRDRTVDLGANAGACLLFISKICASAVVNISRAPNDGGGAGGCIDVDGFHIGGGVLWNGPKVVVWPFDGCKWSRFKIDVKPSLASAAASTQTIVVKRGAPNPALELHGSGAAPLVRVTGPGGQSLDSTDKGFDYSPGGHIRILRYQGQTGDFTIVGLEKAQPGTYTVSTLPGSVPFTEIDSATDPPDAHVTAKVTGTGSRRVLTYDVRPRPDQTVTFSDVNTGGAAQTIGTVNGGGKGHIRFTPAPGRGRRSVVARFTLAGLSAERITVAHFTPPKPDLTTPRGLRIVRHKKKLMISWRAVSGAVHYEVVLTDRTTGYQHLATTRHHSLELTGVPLTVGGTVTVRATDQLRQSLTARATVKRLATPHSSFIKLGHCKLTKHSHKLTCAGGSPAPKHRKHHKKPAKHH
jgi:hypothetical protein